MEPFKIHILGCGSALPTLQHYASSQVVEIRNKLLMVDCGEGTQIALRRSHIRFTKISAVFITHLHGDHFFGLIGMISTFGMLGRTAPLHVYAPSALQPVLEEQIEKFCFGLEYQVVFHTVKVNGKTVVYQDDSIQVEAFPLNHRVECYGYLFSEKPTLPHINREMIDFYKIPVSQINNIKNGYDWQLPDGEVVANSRLVIKPEPPRSYAYCSDTKYMPSLSGLIQNVNLLYHESTYASEDILRAEKYYHSTAAQAAQTASDAHAGQLLLGHYSARYDDENKLLEEARTIFPDTILSSEGMVIDVK